MSLPREASLEIYNEIIDRVNSLMDDDSVDQFTKARIIKELEANAQDLKDLDIGKGFSAMGSIACAKGDIQGMHNNHKQSLKYRTDEVTLFNYAASLAKCGEPDDALSYGKVAYDLNPKDIEVIDFMVSTSDKAKDNKTFLRFSSAFEKIKGEPHPRYLEYVNSLHDLKNVSQLCMDISQSSLAEIWDTPEEDEAWAHLQ